MSSTIRKAVVTCAAVTLATALSSAPAFAKGPPQKASLTASSSCLLTGTASWGKNITVTEVVWTLNRNGAVAGGGFSSGFGALPSPQSISFQQTASATPNTFSVTAQLLNGATPVGGATSKALTVNCF
jgi:hypothetical protein